MRGQGGIGAHYIQRTKPLMANQIVVPRGGIYFIPFSVDATRMQSARVVGRYTVAGGIRNDIRVYITDPDGMENIRNGHQARVWFSTDKVTIGDIDARLPASGEYVLLLDNGFSPFSNKYVNGTIQLQYEEKQ